MFIAPYMLSDTANIAKISHPTLAFITYKTNRYESFGRRYYEYQAGQNQDLYFGEAKRMPQRKIIGQLCEEREKACGHFRLHYQCRLGIERKFNNGNWQTIEQCQPETTTTMTKQIQ